MRTYILGALAAVAVAGTVVLGMAATTPDDLYLSRTVQIDAAPDRVLPYLTDYKKFVQWSPWTGRDPDQEVTYSDEASVVGAWYAWNGDDVVGEGRMDLLSIDPGKVQHKLTFFRPMEDEAMANFSYKAKNGGTEVTWSYEDTIDFGFKVALLFVDFDGILGGDYAEGLANLKRNVEAEG